MRILHIIQHLEVGGAERMVMSLVAGARAAGHDVAVAAAPGRLMAELGVTRFDLPYLRRRVHRLPLVARAVARAERAWSPDIVHCHNPGVALAAGLVPRWRRPARLITIQGVPDDDYPITARVLRWLAVPVVACGPAVEQALAREGLPGRMIPNGVSPPPAPATRSQIERLSSALRDRPIVIAVGRLVAQKNFSVLIQAMAHLADAALLIVGDGPLKGELERVALRAGVSDRVVFAGVRDDARALMGGADVIAITSRWEGLSLVLLEALASGRPVVATRAPSLSDLLVHEATGLLVNADATQELADAIRRLLEDPRLAVRLAGGARLAASRYSEDHTVGEYLALYDALVCRAERQ